MAVFGTFWGRFTGRLWHILDHFGEGSFWGDFGPFLVDPGSFWGLFGVTWESFWHRFGIIFGAVLGSFWHHFWAFFGAVFDHFGAIFGPF